MHILDELLDTYKPDILCICEANLTPDFMKYQQKYQEYNFEVSLIYHMIGTSRNIIIIRNNIPYTRRKDHENNI